MRQSAIKALFFSFLVAAFACPIGLQAETAVGTSKSEPVAKRDGKGGHKDHRHRGYNRGYNRGYYRGYYRHPSPYYSPYYRNGGYYYYSQPHGRYYQYYDPDGYYYQNSGGGVYLQFGL